MPTLDWIGKKAVIKHHKEVPYRLLRLPVAESNTRRRRHRVESAA